MNLENILNKINTIINIFVIFYIIFSIYNTYVNYKLYKQFDNENITKSSDIDTIGEKYSDCKIYKIYNELSDRDKEYLFHIINTSRIKYKEEIPNYNKQVKNIKNGMITNMCATFLTKFKAAAAVDSLKYNVLLSALT